MTKMTLKELNKAIDDVNGRAAKLGDEYQTVGLACLQHLADHGDIGPCNRLYNGMPKSSRRLAMGQWMMAHGQLKVNADRPTQQNSPMVFDKTKEMKLEAAAAIKWWEFAPERALDEVFDLQTAIKSILNRAKGKKIKIGGEFHSAGETAVALRTMCSLVGLKVGAVKVDEVTHKAEVMDDDGKVGDVKPAEVPKEVQDAAKAVVDAAAKGQPMPTTAAPEGAGMQQTGTKEKATAKTKGSKPTAKTKAKGGKASAH